MSSLLEIRECRSARDWRLFERIPELLHGADPCFVPPIPGEVAKLRKGALVLGDGGSVRAFVAWREGAPVGRIAAIVNAAHNAFHGDRAGFFGFFDFADGSVAPPLLAHALEVLAAAGRDIVRGPLNPSQLDECGIQVEGFGDRPYFGMPYTPPWYVDVYASLALEPVRDMLAYPLDPSMEEEFLRRMSGVVERLRQRFPISVRPVDLARLDEEAPLVSRLFNDSLAQEWNFMPLSVGMARRFAKELAGHLDPEAVLIAEVAGEPAGLSIALPDLNEFLVRTRRLPRWLRLPALVWFLKTRKCRRGRWTVFGMLPEYRKRGGTVLLVHEAIVRGRGRYEAGELSWTQDINPDVNKLAAQLGLEPYKRYRLYETRL